MNTSVLVFSIIVTIVNGQAASNGAIYLTTVNTRTAPATATKIKKIDHNSGDITTLNTMTERADFLRIHNNILYWSQQNSIHMLDLETNTPTDLATGETSSTEIAIDIYSTPNKLYWIQGGDGAAVIRTGAITTAGTAAAFYTPTGASITFLQIVQHGSNTAEVWWLEGSDIKMRQVGTAGTTATTVIATGHVVSSLRVDMSLGTAGQVFYTDDTDGLQRYDIATTTGTTLEVDAANKPDSIFLDVRIGDTVMWATQNEPAHIRSISNSCSGTVDCDATQVEIKSSVANLDTAAMDFFVQFQTPHGYVYYIVADNADPNSVLVTQLKRFDTNSNTETTIYDSTTETDLINYFLVDFDDICGNLTDPTYGRWSAVEGDAGGAICGGNQLDDCHLVCNENYDCTGDCLAKCNYGVYETDYTQQCDRKPTVVPSSTNSAVPRNNITFTGDLSSHFCYTLGDDTTIETPVCSLAGCTAGIEATNTSSTAVVGRGLDTMKVVPCCTGGLNVCVLEGDLSTISFNLDYEVCVGCEFMYINALGEYLYDCYDEDGLVFTRIEFEALDGTTLCPV